MTVDTLNYLVGMGTIALQVVTAALALALLLQKRHPVFGEVLRPFGRSGMWIGLLASLFAIVMSLFYSYVIGYPACDLCWFQRICMYPLAVIFAVGIWKKDEHATTYALILSVIGLLIGLYNHALQLFPAGTIPCPAQGVSCAQIFYLEFGYITFPMLSVTLFAFLIIVSLIIRRR